MVDTNGVDAQMEHLIAVAVEKAMAARAANIPPPPPDQTAQLEEIKKLKEEMELLKKKQSGYLATLVRNIPLSAEILESEIPKNFKFPHVGEYNGKGDLEEHLSRFENAALLHKYSDPIKCRVFLNTLVGPTQQWFYLLRPGDITEFKDFSKAFLHHFASSKKHPTTTLSLFAIKQQGQEDLRVYIRRFSALALEVPTATNDLLISAFTQGLTTGNFLKSLIKKPPSTYDKLLARAEKYVNLEEVQVSRLNSGMDRPPSPKNTRIPNTPRRMGPSPRTELLGQFTSFTPLRMGKTQAMRICEERRLLQRPPWSEQGPRRPKSDKYCDFHNEYGHNTNDCRQLEQEIERIIQQEPGMKDRLARQKEGYSSNKRSHEGPDHYAPRPRPGPPQGNFQRSNQNQPGNNQGPPHPTKGVINMIFGGPTDGDSNRARKTISRKLSNMEIVDQLVRTGPTLSFGPGDLKGLSDTTHNDALVIRALVTNYEVARIFVNSGSSVNVLFQETINQMDLGEYKVEPVVTSLFRFTGHAIRPTGLINLPLTLGKDHTSKTRIVSFIIVDAPSAYNVILGRPAMTTFMAVASALYQKIKFPVGNEVGEVQGDQKISRKCYVEEVQIKQKATKVNYDDRPGPRDREQVNLLEENAPVTAEKECEEIMICPPTGSVRVARTLEPILKEQLIQCLMKNKYALAWSVSDLLGVRREVMEHKLNVIRDYCPIIQKKRHFGPEKDAMIQEHVEERLKAGHIQEVYFPTWLSNVVLVPKSSGKWRMCVDFRDLNKACPKDCYSLPRIDQLVDSTSGHELLCFLDAYQGYHQIPLAKQDQDKVSFVTSTGTYCYVVMPFGLKNAGATYQRLMDKVFKQQIGKNI
ncbi:uncharacterized protein [Henckelia pumila]|uniref:uncharacterized protein n=1 Tax=Henckelia pumila TaxID=405737 RepID=UPI003C6EA0FA